MSDIFIMDSCALIAILKKKEADKVAAAYRKAEIGIESLSTPMSTK